LVRESAGKQEKVKNMASSEKRKSNVSKTAARDPVSGLTQAQLLQLQKSSSASDDTGLAGTRFDHAPTHSQITNSGLPPLNSLPAELDTDKVFAFYPSVGDPAEADRPTLVDAVIEQLRQARLRRLRPH
jgi:hypothetical protein